jgi:hypothetical protein
MRGVQQNFAHFIGFWRKLTVIQYYNKNQGFTRLSITNKTIDRLNIKMGFYTSTYPGRATGANLNLAPGSTWKPSFRNENHHGQRNRTPKIGLPNIRLSAPGYFFCNYK